ncbi:helix-turn-helix transcriptional regulator [Alteromonas gracilis]|uniref:helix-turn-helix transcriptional regulator n=1 Tax=Alteromonas gracilis TaxID=1479524 RepID=UPI0030D3FF0D
MKDKIITTALLIIMFLNFRDVIIDLSLNVPTSHIIEESMIVLVAGLMAIYLIFDIRLRTRKTKRLLSELHSTRVKLKSMNNQLQLAKAQYLHAVEVQFDEWRLTPSEKEVALFMLKGLSTQEIAAARNTKEKTVRQQASAVYAKSQLEGRYALSAWFFEDILQQDQAA